ncbi:Arabinanase/levansucrase/invertase superfamily protein [Mycena chlorophos]|uniref:Arabinanase/levansucrase/invertase superfamily protein n=1 Tax=Mycena chlorophos TaxID=658473 RepID=A0A8H6TLB8_MYCCL|nr:Arabinanase/levansucrase/invertase superfamily protein [Mycena chlorophos]
MKMLVFGPSLPWFLVKPLLALVAPLLPLWHSYFSSTRTYTNPILEGNHADPWILQHDNTYYLTPTMPDGTVGVFRSGTLDNFTGVLPRTVWVPPNTTTGVWAPELHRIGGEFYIYCAVQDGYEDADRRMHVLRGTDAQDPTAPFIDLGQIGTADSNYAIDGTVLQHSNGNTYFIWSGKESRALGTVQYLYIAEMDTPYSLYPESQRMVIHSPYWPNGTKNERQWSTSNPVYGVNEGPQIVTNNERTFLIYSACGSWDPCYSLWLMGLKNSTADPLDPNSWWSKDDEPVFFASEDTVGTGHASFSRDAEGVPYMTYHAWDSDAPAGWTSREVRTQRFDFDSEGIPIFPSAIAAGVELPGAAGYG